MSAGGPILLIDTATTRAVVALGAADGSLLEQRAWVAGYRHGEELLARIEGLLADRGVSTAELGAIAVGTGPGAFTGLRVGIATAKGLAHALAVPIIGIASGIALLDAALAASSEAASLVLLQPAGPNDRVLTRRGEPARILPGGTDPDLGPGEQLVAVDLDGRADDAAVDLGHLAVDGLAAAMLSTAARRLGAGNADDLATLVPEYVTLPRGVRMPPTDQGVEVTGSGTGSATGGDRA
jgi:tRNA threonylcarbamoyl adenosine modification protein YeaZ